jgi:hypothetical protein
VGLGEETADFTDCFAAREGPRALPRLKQMFDGVAGVLRRN